MNLLDLLLVAVILLSGISGFRRGAALQLTVYAGLLLGLAAGAILAPPLSDIGGSGATRALLALAVLVGMAALGDAVGWVVGTRLWARARRSVLGSVDAAAGSLVAAAAVLLAIWFVAFNLVNGPFPALAREIRRSAVVRAVDTVLPRPPPLLASVRQLLNQFGFPEVFAGLPPPPAGPVEGPEQGDVSAAAEQADGSTVRIVGQACDAVQEGSGFVAAEQYVVTNAHVVAGVGQPRVQEQNGGSHRAVTVLFDPDVDIAVLWVEAAPADPLSLENELHRRGTSGAVIGYPRGGPLTFGPAAVRRSLSATGRDIYGRSTVTREVYELQAEVRPGNSGGPFVLSDGSVAGVVFAASTTDPMVAYALISTEVTPLLERALGRTEPVSTGGCLR